MYLCLQYEGNVRYVSFTSVLNTAAVPAFPVDVGELWDNVPVLGERTKEQLCTYIYTHARTHTRAHTHTHTHKHTHSHAWISRKRKGQQTTNKCNTIQLPKKS
jgi:hypothetical protein